VSRGVERPAWRRLATPVLLTALVGAVLGMGLATPRYRSEGLVRVEPRLPNPEDPCGRDLNPMIAGFMAYQEQLLRARRTTLLALDTETWKKAGEDRGPDAAESFEARRDVVCERGWLHLLVRFEDTRPGVALAGLRALLEAYESLIRDMNDDDERLQYAQAQGKKLQEQIDETSDAIKALAKEYGGVEGLQARHIEIVSQLIEMEHELMRVRTELHGREAGIGGEQAELRARAEMLEARLDNLQALSRELGRVRAEIARLQAEKAGLERQAEQMGVIADQLEARLLGTGPVTVESRGELPTAPFDDPRPCAAALGAVLGALLSLLLALVLGRRYA